MLLSMITLSLLSLLLYLWMKQPRRLALPGPRGLPLIGNLTQLDPCNPHGHLTKWADKYGGVYAINLMGENWVVVSSYEALHEILIKRGPEFANRPDIYRPRYATFGRKDIIWQNFDGHFYNVGKKLLHRSVKQYGGGIERLELVVNTMLSNFKDKLDKTEAKPHNPKVDIYNFTVQSLLYLAVGKFLDEDSDVFKLSHQMERLSSESCAMTGSGSELDAFPWLRFFNNKCYKMITRGKELSTVIWNKFKPDLLENLDVNDQRCVMDSALLMQLEEKNTQKERGGEAIQDINLQLLLTDILIAGTTTTVNSLSAFVNLMVHYPDVQDRIQKEVSSVVGSSRVVTVLDRQNMPYTRATVYELNRFVSVVPLGVPHVTTKECELNGATLPKGTNILTNTWGLHHDERFWGDPWQFRPERFLDEQGELLPADHENRKHLLPFGAGSRVCIGEVFAMTRMFLFITSVLQHFIIQPAPGEKMSCDPRNYILGITLSPKDFDVCFIPRA